jgi:hypothetical protein
MGLSRLDNFLKNIKGEILYVDPSSLDSTDNIENQGNSLARPFKTIQRALVEAARFSYQRGLDNDRFGKTTILLYPGEHIVDNRPGLIPTGSSTYLKRSSEITNDFPPFSGTTDFNLNNENNQLYKLNSVHGGVILPRGTSIIGLDLRKTKIRPKYVPDPLNSNIERSAVFRLTGSSYLWQFSIFDADPNGNVYKDYTSNLFVPNFSHHKLTVFEYADGVNPVKIDDDFISSFSTPRTDLDIYYQKIGLAYGGSSGRNISPDYPSSDIDIQTKVDEFRIVGSTGQEASIANIIAGDGIESNTLITVTLSEAIDGLDVDTPIQIQNVDTSGYNGQFVVSEVVNSTTIRYQVQNPPIVPSPALAALANSTLVLVSDTVTSASPYIFNISLRSVYGMCGMHADGSKATGFKSMVVAQYTGIGLQKDDNAFVLYDEETGSYIDRTSVANLYSNSRARYKPEFQNYHIRASNNAIIQIVSVFAIGYAEHFKCDSGGDLSITNSNSNFGARALVSTGFRLKAFDRDNFGYITHIIPPRENVEEDISIEYYQLDVEKTNSVGTAGRIYLYNQTNQDIAPDHIIDGYRIGGKNDELLNLRLSISGVTSRYTAAVIMNGGSSENIAEKLSIVDKKINGVSNDITNNIITFKDPHDFVNGETIRAYSDDGHLPDGLSIGKAYYVITSEVITGLSANQIKLAQSVNEATIGEATSIYSNETSELRIVSRVIDKKSGENGHPVQYDSVNNQWYITVSTVNDTISSTISSLGLTASPRTYITRTPDTRSFADSIYRMRYVIPKGFLTARIPIDGYVIQESGSTTSDVQSEIESYLSIDDEQLNSTYQLRNFRFIYDAEWSGGTATIYTELPHNLSVGSQVKINKILSTNNTTGTDNSGFNGTFTVLSTPGRKKFTVSISIDPGTFTNNINTRNTNLPHFLRTRYSQTYVVYRSQEIQRYIPGEQDGVYNLVVLNTSNKPEISPFEDLNLLQPLQYLYPQTSRDNLNSDPLPSKSFASSSTIGEVLINDPQRSITKETVNKRFLDNGIGLGLNNIISDATGDNHNFYFNDDHGLNRVTEVSIVDPGSNYGTGIGVSEVFYNARLAGLGTAPAGIDATAIVRIDDTTGGLLEIKIIDGGSAYGIGNTLAVIGIAQTTNHTIGIVSVTSIYDNTNDCISVLGVTPDNNTQYNTVYRIAGIQTGQSKYVETVVSHTIEPVNPGVGIGITATRDSYVLLGDPVVGVSSVIYNNVTGIATIRSNQYHGLFLNNKIRIGGASVFYYNDDFVVTRILDRNAFEIKVGVNTTAEIPTGDIRIFRERLTSSGGNVTKKSENISGRLVPNYAGITTTLAGEVTGPDIDNIIIDNAVSLGLRLGDYLEVNNEIMRIRETVRSNQVEVFRGVLGTYKSTHLIGIRVSKIDPTPVEFRRNSIIRASGHTFEYVGYGPGNYSTALPDRQDRRLSAGEEITAASLKLDGGVAVYTAMNDQGSFFVGNRKVNAATGQEEVFGAPIPTVAGEDLNIEGINIGFDVLSPLEVKISRSLKVEGGEDGSIVSEFDSPVVFTNKITSTSPKGIEANALFLQGEQLTSKKYTVGVSQPSDIGSPGDVVYYTNPQSGGYLGWVYTTDNRWEEFGPVKIDSRYVGIWSGSFFGDGGGLINVSDVWKRDVGGVGLVTTSEVGIGTTATIDGVALYVEGKSRINGITTFADTTQSYTPNDGSTIFEGGVGIKKSLNVGGDFSVVGITTLTDLYIDTISGIATFTDNVTFNDDVTVETLLSTNHFEVTGIATMRDNLYIRNQSIRAFVNGTAIIFGI